MSYKERIENIDFLENTWQTALNQTEIYSLITKHFRSPLPGGKKKAIVIGYDGYKCGHGGDTLQERITFIISNREIL